jgi:hypothetical protein
MTRFTDRVERDLGQIADRATPSSTAWEAIRHRIDEQDFTEPTMEVIMLSPETNRHDNRTRHWLMAAAGIAALALIGGLIFAGTRADEDTVPADETPAAVPVTIALELPVTVTYPGFGDFALQELFVTPMVDDTSTEADDDPDTDYVQAVVEITIPATGTAKRLVSHGTLMRLSGPGVDDVNAKQVWNEAHERQTAPLSLEPGQSVVRQWSFPVPAGTDPSTLTIRIGTDGEAGAAIPLADPAPTAQGD